jgi:predicted dinucleotide-binding enzyme
VARCLIIGCGCRGQGLARSLAAQGHAVRGTTREASRFRAIESAGAEATLADPDRVATVIHALDHVTVACILLGSAVAPPELLDALHGTRLEMLLSRLVDTTVKGVVYEASGTVDAAVLERGACLVRGFGERTHARVSVLSADPADHRAWLPAAARAVEEVLER